MAPLDPSNLTPAASLNRMPVLAPAGVALDADDAGKLAYDLLSRDALAREIRRQADVLRIDHGPVDDADLPIVFDRCFESTLPEVRRAAAELARRFGRRLGALALTLHRGELLARAARDDWDASYWTHWASVRTITIGGGLASGNLGPRAVEAAAALLAEAGAGLVLRHAAFPALLPLIGAARTVPAGHAAALVFDWGQTSTKRALANFDDDALTGLRLLPAVPTRWRPFQNGAQVAAGGLNGVAATMAALLADTWQQHRSEHELAPVLMCSLASYVADNHPLPRPGSLYGALHAGCDNLGRRLAAEVSARVGRPIHVVLLHDGTAAARAYAGEPDGAVITMGTALGIGFTPSSAGLRTVDPRLAVIAHRYSS